MALLRDIESYIRSGETSTQKLGLEIEHFIVDGNGDQIPFEEISSLVEDIGNKIGAKLHYIDGYPVGYYTGKYSTSLEPSCQFEISIDPYDDLQDIFEVYNEFYDLWEPIFSSRGYRIITKGNLPKVELGFITPDDIPLSPKTRYKYMDEHFKESGRYGKHMMRASASTQVSVDYKNEEDLVRKIRILKKISPLLMLIMESKTCEDSTLSDHPDKKHLLRIQEWEDLDPDRTGFITGSLDSGFGYKDIADTIYRTPLILLSENGNTSHVGYKTAEDLVKEGKIADESELDSDRIKLIEHIISMGFFHLRIKKYIEIRVADSVHINKALGYVALLKGLLYSESAFSKAEKLFNEVRSADDVYDAINAIEIQGWDAVIYGGHPVTKLAGELLDIAEENLSDKDKEYLNNVRTAGN